MGGAELQKDAVVKIALVVCSTKTSNYKTKCLLSLRTKAGRLKKSAIVVCFGKTIKHNNDLNVILDIAVGKSLRGAKQPI